MILMHNRKIERVYKHYITYILMPHICLLVLLLFIAQSGFAETGKAPMSGVCGENITWLLTQQDESSSDLILELNGTGATFDYSPQQLPPWNAYKDAICECSISNGVTKLGNYLLWDCQSVTTLYVPESITAFGSYCTPSEGLTEIYLPDSLSSIGEHAITPGCIVYCKSKTATSSYISSCGYRYRDPRDKRFLLKDNRGYVTVVSYYQSNGTPNPFEYHLVIPDYIDRWDIPDYEVGPPARIITLPSTLNENSIFAFTALYTIIPEGVSSAGYLALPFCHAIYLPSSICDLSRVSIDLTSQGQVFCYSDSEAELWALLHDYEIIYRDKKAEYKDRGGEYADAILEVGESYTFNAYDAFPVPFFIEDCSSPLSIDYPDDNITINGTTIIPQEPGDYQITVFFAGNRMQAHIHVNQPILDFDIVLPPIAKAGTSIPIQIINIETKDGNDVFDHPKFTVSIDNAPNQLVQTFAGNNLPNYIDIPLNSGVALITITANGGGLSKEATLIVSEEISDPYLSANSSKAVIGSVIDILIDSGEKSFKNIPFFCDNVVLNKSAQQYLQINEDSLLQVIGVGRCVVTVCDFEGKEHNYIVSTCQPNDILTLPDDTISIEDYSFGGVNAQKVIIPYGCVSIGKEAFAASNIQIASIPPTIEYIADDAFDGCQGLVFYYTQINEYIHDWATQHSIPLYQTND